MKKLFLFLFILIAHNSIQAQFTGNSNSGLYAEYVQNTKNRPALNNIRTYVGAKEYETDPITNYQGSPFLTSEFIKGNIYLNGELQHANIPLRYNSYKDQFEIEGTDQENNRNALYLTKAKGVSVRIAQRSFIVLASEEEQGLQFYEALYLGDKVQLYKRNIQIFTPEKAAPTSMTRPVPAKFNSSEIYYVREADGTLRKLPKGNQKMIKSFANNQSALKEFSKKYRLDLKSEKDLKRLITYYNSL